MVWVGYMAEIWKTSAEGVVRLRTGREIGYEDDLQRLP